MEMKVPRLPVQILLSQLISFLQYPGSNVPNNLQDGKDTSAQCLMLAALARLKLHLLRSLNCSRKKRKTRPILCDSVEWYTVAEKY